MRKLEDFALRQIVLVPSPAMGYQRYKLSNAIDEKPASASSARCSLLTTDSGLESAS